MPPKEKSEIGLERMKENGGDSVIKVHFLVGASSSGPPYIISFPVDALEGMIHRTLVPHPP